jgi:hypothetical protein
MCAMTLKDELTDAILSFSLLCLASSFPVVLLPSFSLFYVDIEFMPIQSDSRSFCLRMTFGVSKYSTCMAPSLGHFALKSQHFQTRLEWNLKSLALSPPC